MSVKPEQQHYIGRFAPSPSGPLHFGSVLTALASYLDAKANQGLWLLRIDNIDPPREQAGSIESILNTLEALELRWDKSVIYQGQRIDDYIDSCSWLIRENLAYPCYCSRKSLAHFEQYPNTCRKMLTQDEKKDLLEDLEKRKKQDINNPAHSAYSLRLNTQGINHDLLAFDDLVFGQQKCPDNFGDFIILRKDGLPSYMLACGHDEITDKITHLVRGADLITSTFWQRALQLALTGKVAEMEFAHLPIVVNELGQKFSKQHHAPEIDIRNKSLILFKALEALHQEPESCLQDANCSDILEWSIENWSLAKVSRNTIPYKELGIN